AFSAWAIAGAGAVALLGSLLPWMQLTGLFGYQFTANGGVLAILLALAIGALGVWMLLAPPPHRGRVIAALVCAGLLTLLVVLEFIAIGAINTPGFARSVGPGGFVTLVGAVAAGAGAIVHLRGPS